LKLHTLSARRPYLDVLFLTDVFNGLKCHPTLLETVGLREPNRNFRDVSVFILTLNVESVLPLDALRRKMPSTAILMYRRCGSSVSV